jgi:hypothetical protein
LLHQQSQQAEQFKTTCLLVHSSVCQQSRHVVLLRISKFEIKILARLNSPGSSVEEMTFKFINVADKNQFLAILALRSSFLAGWQTWAGVNS